MNRMKPMNLARPLILCAGMLWQGTTGVRAEGSGSGTPQSTVVCVNDTATAAFTASIGTSPKKPEECSTEPTANVAWTITSGSGATITGSGENNRIGSFAYKPTACGVYPFTIQAVATWKDCNDKTLGTPTKSEFTITVTAVEISFDKDSVIVGIGANRTSETPVYPATTPATYPYRLTATITCKDTASLVTFKSSKEERATVAEVGTRSVVGDSIKVILKVTGKTETPVESEGGDADVQALVNGAPCKTVKIKVLIPKAIHSPHPVFANDISGVNLVTDANSSPATYGLPNGMVQLVSWYGVRQTIRVDDQFGKSLHAIYAGAVVTENAFSINQSLSSAGTYSDAVGRVIPVAVVASTDSSVATFPSDPVQPLPRTGVHLNADTPVEVDGISLNPAIAGRVFTIIYPNHAAIVWPPDSNP